MIPFFLVSPLIISLSTFTTRPSKSKLARPPTETIPTFGHWLIPIPSQF